MKRKKLTAAPLFVILLSGLVFLALYRRFLFGDTIYLFSDTGSDSLAASYPILRMVNYLFQSRTFSSYTLFSGLGQDTTAVFLQFLNPLKIFMLFFDENALTDAIVIQLFAQTVISSLCFYYYVRRHLKTDAAAVLASAIWAFSSFTVLWSQNLSYGTAVCMFMISLLLIENLLDFGSLPAFLLLSMVLAFFVCSNYYFCYMTAVFTILYIPLRAIFLKKPVKETFLGFFKTGFSAAFAVLLSAAAAAAIAQGFLYSARTEDVHSITYYKWSINPRFLLGCLARLFSENMLGIESAYKGPTNYYEIGAIFTSVLFLFAFFYLLQKRRTWFKVLFVSVLCFFALMIPALRYILDLSSLCMRFSFMICLLEAIAAAVFFDMLFTEPDRRAMLVSVILTLLFTAASYAVLFLLGPAHDIAVYPRTILFSAATTLLAAGLLLIIRTGKVPSRAVPFALALFIAGEAVVMHHDSLYLRLYLTKDSFSTSFFQSGTEEAVRALEDEDSSLYRISSTEDMNLSNEGQAEHFNGTTLRNNTNSRSLMTLEDAHGTNERYGPYFLSGYPQYYQFTLLSGKYIVRTETDSHKDFTETSLFKKVLESPGHAPGTKKVVYENENALPFGYLYTEQVPRDTYDSLDLMDKMQLLTKAWFYTDAADEESGSAPEGAAAAAGGSETAAADSMTDDVRKNLITDARWENPHNMEIEQKGDDLLLRSTGIDPYIFVYMDNLNEDPDVSNYLLIRADREKARMFDLELFYLSEEGADPDPAWRTQLYFDGSYPECLLLLPEGVRGFRFDFDDDTDSALLDSIELITCREPLSHFEKLKSTAIRDISFGKDLYSAHVSSENGGMLCVPILYSPNWSATVNGEKTKLYNINGGFLGLPLKAGEADVKIRYTLPYFKLGVFISALSLLAYIILWIVALLRKLKKKEPETENREYEVLTEV